MGEGGEERRGEEKRERIIQQTDPFAYIAVLEESSISAKFLGL